MPENFKCTKCQAAIVVSGLPKPEVFNSATYSAMVAPHEKMIRCPSCGQTFIPFIKSLRTEWGFAESQAPPEPSRVLLFNQIPNLRSPQ